MADSENYRSFTIRIRKPEWGQTDTWKQTAERAGQSLTVWVQKTLNAATREAGFTSLNQPNSARELTQTFEAGRELGIWCGWLDCCFQAEAETLIPVEEFRQWLTKHPQALHPLRLWMARQPWGYRARPWWDRHQLPRPAGRHSDPVAL